MARIQAWRLPGASFPVRHALIIFLAVAVSLSFYLEGLRNSLDDLGGDQINILTVCLKKANPDLLGGDLVVADFNNVAYYIPWFVDLINFLSVVAGGYVQALNVILLLTSLLFMFGWYLFFGLWGDSRVAALTAFLVRGIIWVPGWEFWGISGLWTMVPRTLFLALLPYVLWGWYRYRDQWVGWLVCCFAAGLLANVHPISGACLAVGLISAEGARSWFAGGDWLLALKRCVIGGLCVLCGMAPYLLLFRGVVSGAAGVDPLELRNAIRMRIASSMLDPVLYLRRWLRPQLLCLLLGPWIALLVFARKSVGSRWDLVVGLGAFSAAAFACSIGAFPAEAALRSAGVNVNVAFQLVRVSKYALVGSFGVLAGLLTLLDRRLSANPWYRKASAWTPVVLVSLVVLAKSHAFDRVPYLGDDMARTLLPQRLGDKAVSEKSLIQVMDWIQRETPPDARLVGPRLLRVGARRPVIHDWPGAGMLIEGNPAAFVAASRREAELRKPEYRDAVRLAELYASWGAQYWVTDLHDARLPLVFADKQWAVYRLDGLSVSPR